MLTSLLGEITLYISDPAIVKDLYTKHNKLVDKNGRAEIIFKSLVGHSFLFSKANEEWKQKRRACAHAFYKDRLALMMDTFKL